jgi:hypothetical protein
VATENAGLRVEFDKLHLIIKVFQRHRFGQRLEQLNGGQKQLVARFSQIEGYRCLSLTRAFGVVKCQLALA